MSSHLGMDTAEPSHACCQNWPFAASRIFGARLFNRFLATSSQHCCISACGAAVKLRRALEGKASNSVTRRDDMRVQQTSGTFQTIKNTVLLQTEE
ncbi:Hypothetical predicted protein [Podarcis lilfordi]|uniref:Uncharacterized protein n=1 Tax=Podarcis lilfordi TaxID=74358 RepID=A0AA35JVW5_9SAUR|nr:Hypothetical predicted protein [Podarcis lilfordi]